MVRNSAKLSASATSANSATAWPYRSASKPSPAVALFTEVALADDFVDFLTLPAYERMP